MMNTTKPTKGDTMTVRGMVCTIVKVYPFGTCDVKTPAGKFLRITGLGWL